MTFREILNEIIDYYYINMGCKTAASLKAPYTNKEIIE